jgi:uncharacterized protein (TIGR02246 family)
VNTVNTVNKDKKFDQGSLANAPQDAEDAGSKVGPYNPALGEIYQRLYPEMRRPKPNQEAIAAALQAMQRLTMKMDSETAVEETSHAGTALSIPCGACGHLNREGNRFCAMCGTRAEGTKGGGAGLAATELENVNPQAERSPVPSSPVPGSSVRGSAISDSRSRAQRPSLPVHGEVEQTDTEPAGAPGTHHYHHHYHHHYFPGGSEIGGSSPRAIAPETARETDRLRIAAAAKGEPMTRNEAAVRRLTQEWVLACNMRQLDELLELYAPDAVVLRSNLPLLRGAAQIREFFFSALESGLGEVSLEPMRVEISGEIAHEVGRYSALVPGNAGKRREERGKYLWVFAKPNGGDWKLVSECWSSDLTLTNAESDVPKTALSASPKGPTRKL